MTTPTQKRATIYFDPELPRALRLKTVEINRSISDLVDEAVRVVALAEDAEDLVAFEERALEPNLIFEEVVKDLNAWCELGLTNRSNQQTPGAAGPVAR